MKEKELKKLSRLELLEILLEETKENEGLRKDLEAMQAEKESNALLVSLTESLDNTLKQAKQLTSRLDMLNDTASEKPNRQSAPPTKPASLGQKKAGTVKESDKSLIVSDMKLYLQILKFYYENDTALRLLPENLQEEIRARIRGIINAKK